MKNDCHSSYRLVEPPASFPFQNLKKWRDRNLAIRQKMMFKQNCRWNESQLFFIWLEKKGNWGMISKKRWPMRNHIVFSSHHAVMTSSRTRTQSTFEKESLLVFFCRLPKWKYNKYKQGCLIKRQRPSQRLCVGFGVNKKFRSVKAWYKMGGCFKWSLSRHSNHRWNDFKN